MSKPIKHKFEFIQREPVIVSAYGKNKIDAKKKAFEKFKKQLRKNQFNIE